MLLFTALESTQQESAVVHTSSEKSHYMCRLCLSHRVLGSYERAVPREIRHTIVFQCQKRFSSASRPLIVPTEPYCFISQKEF